MSSRRNSSFSGVSHSFRVLSLLSALVIFTVLVLNVFEFKVLTAKAAPLPLVCASQFQQTNFGAVNCVLSMSYSKTALSLSKDLPTFVPSVPSVPSSNAKVQPHLNNNWSAKQSPLTQNFGGALEAISCPTTLICFAMSAGSTGGLAITTTDGGNNWSIVPNFLPSGFPAVSFYGISCPTAQICFADGTVPSTDGTLTGQTGVINATTDGGNTWKIQVEQTGVNFTGVSCPTTTTCFVTGYLYDNSQISGQDGLVATTTNGGSQWNVSLEVQNSDFQGISCITASECFATGDTTLSLTQNAGLTIVTTNGGSNWSKADEFVFPAGVNTLHAISCPSSSVCYTVGDLGAIRATTNGGSSWATQASGSNNSLFSISCATTTNCYVGGGTDSLSLIVGTNDGQTWANSLSAYDGLNYVSGLSCTAVDSCLGVTAGDYLLSNTAPPAPASLAASAGASQSAAEGSAFGTLFQVTAKDSKGNPVSGVKVTFTAPTSGASGSFASATGSVASPNVTTTITTATANTNSNGVATAPAFTANNTAGSYTVVASVSGSSVTAVFNLTNTQTGGTGGGTGTYTYYLPFVPSKASFLGGTNFSYLLNLQNVGTQPAQITITYYNQSGVAVGLDTDGNSAIPPLGKYVTQTGMPTGTIGSAVIVSTQPLATNLTEAGNLNGKVVSSNYAGVSGSTNAGAVILAPIALNQAYGSFGTTLMLQNGSSSSTTATIQYYSYTGNLQTTQSIQIAAKGVAIVNTDDSASLPHNFVGWALISSSNSQTLAGVESESNPSSNFFSTVTCLGSGSKQLFIPVVFQNAFGNFNTGMSLTNPTGTVATVTITYYRKDGTIIHTPYDSLQIPPYGQVDFYHGDARGFSAFGSNFVGSAFINSTQVLAATVNQAGVVNNNALSGTFGTIQGGSSIELPIIAKNASGFSTGLQLLNTGAPSTFTISFINPDGTLAYKGEIQQNGGSIPTGGSINLYEAADTNLPNGFDGAAVITPDVSGGSAIVITNYSDGNYFYTYAEPDY